MLLLKKSVGSFNELSSLLQNLAESHNLFLRVEEDKKISGVCLFWGTKIVATGYLECSTAINQVGGTWNTTIGKEVQKIAGSQLGPPLLVHPADDHPVQVPIHA